MPMNNFNNGYQLSNNYSGNGYGTNYLNQSSTVSSPITIGFVQGKMGAATFPMMSSNTTAYLFDVQDQTKFYIKATDAFGMSLPLREFAYEEITQIQPTPTAIPDNIKEQQDTVIEPPKEMVTKEEFDELKAQIQSLTQSLQQRQNNQMTQKQRKDRPNNV